MKVVIDGVEYGPVEHARFKVGDYVRVLRDSAVARVIGVYSTAAGRFRYELHFKESHQTAFDPDLEPYGGHI